MSKNAFLSSASALLNKIVTKLNQLTTTTTNHGQTLATVSSNVNNISQNVTSLTDRVGALEQNSGGSSGQQILHYEKFQLDQDKVIDFKTYLPDHASWDLLSIVYNIKINMSFEGTAPAATYMDYAVIGAMTEDGVLTITNPNPGQVYTVVLVAYAPTQPAPTP